VLRAKLGILQEAQRMLAAIMLSIGLVPMLPKPSI
jgi:hypothetical protein